jgi:transcriptional regulator with XRE-family HTH domain
MSFKENLKNEMGYQDLQLKELAAKTGISKNTLVNYLTGHNSVPGADSAVKIARALGVSVEYLVTGKTHAEEYNKTIPIRFRDIILEMEKLDSTDIETIRSVVLSMQKRYKQETGQEAVNAAEQHSTGVYRTKK